MNSMKIKKDIDLHLVKITGKRILLLPITLDFNKDIFQEFTEEITHYMIPSPPNDIKQVNSFIEMCQQGMNANSDLVFVITNICNNEFLGVCGLHEKSNPLEPELGIWIKKSAHGNHYGREAIINLVKWAEINISYDFLRYPVDKKNISSRKIAEHLQGKIIHETEIENMSGHVLNEVVYRIG